MDVCSQIAGKQVQVMSSCCDNFCILLQKGLVSGFGFEFEFILFGSMLHNFFKIPRRQNCCDCCWCMEVRPSSEFFEIFPSRHHPMKGDEHSVRVFCFRQGSSLYRVLLDFSRASKICFLSPLRRWYGRLNPALSTLFRVPGGISFEEIETFRANTTTS